MRRVGGAVRRRWPAVLAWGLLGVELALFATLPWIDRLNRAAGRPDVYVLGPFAIPPTVAALTAGVVGAVLASRRPRHPVGWLLLTVGLVLLLTPTGSAPSPGWRRWAFASSAAMAALAVAATVAPGSVDARVLSIEGPVGPHAFGGALAVFNQLAWPPPSSSSLAGPARW